MYDLKDKVVIVTGAAKGVGAAVAVELLTEGVKHVRILDVDEAGGLQLEGQLKERFGATRVKFTKCDVSKDEFLSAIEETAREQQYLDVLFNNAGLTIEENYNAIRTTVGVNVTAVLIGTQKAVELMDVRRGGRGGVIVNISSNAGLFPSTMPLSVYSTTRAAVIMFSEHMGKEPMYSETGVRIMSVCYGATDTPILGNMRSFGGFRDHEIKKMLAEGIKLVQSATEAARGTIEACKRGKSADVWVVRDGLPAYNITEARQQCHQIMIKMLQ